MAHIPSLLDVEETLTVACDMEIQCKDKIKAKNKDLLYQPLNLSQELLMDAESKDVTLISNYEKDSSKTKEKGQKDNEIHCHKFILTSRSDVFRAMFSHDHTTESRTNTITIEDTPKEVLQEFVNYLYTDKCESLTSDCVEDIGDMLRLADKYNVLSLKQHCENRLVQLINSSTVGEIYNLAYFHNCEHVGFAVARYVSGNFDEAFKSNWMANFTQGMQDKLMKDIWTQKLAVTNK